MSHIAEEDSAVSGQADKTDGVVLAQVVLCGGRAGFVSESTPLFHRSMHADLSGVRGTRRMV